jgi:hypothetical protein
VFPYKFAPSTSPGTHTWALSDPLLAVHRPWAGKHGAASAANMLPPLALAGVFLMVNAILTTCASGDGGGGGGRAP